MSAALFKKPLFVLVFSVSCFSVPVGAQMTESPADSVLYPLPKKYLSAKSLLVPVSFVGYGFAAIHTGPIREINKSVSKGVQGAMPRFNTKLDDYLKHAPAATLFVLSATGVKSKHQFLGKAVIYVVSTEICAELIKRLKRATHQLRPDGSTYNSFPSGHTATAFVGAEMLHQEYGSRSPWYSIAGYTLAGGTAVLRVLNNRHWLGDVIAGAGIGMLSTKVGYWLYSKVEKKKTGRRKMVY